MNHPLLPAPEPVVFRDGAPWSEQFSDYYWATGGDPAEEKRLVFLQGNRLAERWRALEPGSDFFVGEIGFGTGLNLLCSWLLWRRTAPLNCALHYLAFDCLPPDPASLRQLHGRRPEMAELTQMLLQCGLPRTGGVHRLLLPAAGAPAVRLTLAIGDAAEQLSAMRSFAPPAIQAWYLDAFAPDRNPQGWSEHLIGAMAQASAAGATAASYSAAGAVRRTLEGAGFAVERRPGFGRKRHRLEARRLEARAKPQSAGRISSGLRLLPNKTRPNEAVIVGAGLAGACCARSLAERGCRVRLLESGAHPGGGASANPATLLRPRLNPGASLRHLHWQLSGWQFALQRLKAWADWKPTGAMQYLPTERSLRRAHKLCRLRPQGDLWQLKDQAAASEIAAVELNGQWLLYPDAGWINTASLCARIADHANIDFCPQAGVHKVGPVGRAAKPGAGAGWALSAADGRLLAETDCCILATGSHAGLQLPAEIALPRLSGKRARLLQAPAEADSSRLQLPLCGRGVFFPPIQGSHWLSAGQAGGGPGAFFRHPPSFLTQATDAAIQHSWQAMRWYSPTRLPLTGQLAEGLHCLWGLGSRGLAYGPVAAEYLVSLLLGEPAPVGAAPDQPGQPTG